jgi:hypothetical protein
MSEEQTVFVDAKGRHWYPKLTGRVVADYESLTGIGLLEAAFSVFQSKTKELAEGEIPTPSNVDILAMGSKLFGNFGHLQYLLYWACRQSDGKVRCVVDRFTNETAEIEFEDFKDGIDKTVSKEATVTAMALLMEFLPDTGEIMSEGGAQSGGPFDRGNGGTLSKPPQSQG